MKLFYREIGTGPPIFIFHGLFGSSDNWQTFGKSLAAKGFRVIMADLRDHGKSPHSDDFSFESFSADIDELFVDLDINSAVVMGHSLGGKAAMQFAFDHPDKISGLIVIDIAPRSYEVQHQRIIDALNEIDLGVNTSRAAVTEKLSASIKDEDTLQFLLKGLYWVNENQLGWRFNLDLITNQIVNAGKTVTPQNVFTKPALFISGERSSYITREDEDEIGSKFLNVDFMTAPGAGHWVHADNPEWLLNSVVSFLTKVSSGETH